MGKNRIDRGQEPEAELGGILAHATDDLDEVARQAEVEHLEAKHSHSWQHLARLIATPLVGALVSLSISNAPSSQLGKGTAIAFAVLLTLSAAGIIAYEFRGESTRQIKALALERKADRLIQTRQHTVDSTTSPAKTSGAR